MLAPAEWRIRAPAKRELLPRVCGGEQAEGLGERTGSRPRPARVSVSAQGPVDSCQKGREEQRPDSRSQTILGNGLRPERQTSTALESVSLVDPEIQAQDLVGYKGFELASPVRKQKGIHVFSLVLFPLHVCAYKHTQRCKHEILVCIQFLSFIFLTQQCHGNLFKSFVHHPS